MNAFDIVGWSFDADLHCTACARKRFGKALFDEENPPEDGEGNEVHPIFASDFDGDAENCGDCADPIFDAEDEDEDDDDCGCGVHCASCGDTVSCEDAVEVNGKTLHAACADCDDFEDGPCPVCEARGVKDCKAFAEDCHDCEPGCPGDSAHLDGFCARAKAEDDPCTVCGGKLEGSLAVCCGQCDNCR